jgi:hypothetical protein
MFDRLAGDTTIFDYARSEAYPLPRILDLAERATSRDAGELPSLLAALDDPHPVIRYWAATGCLVLGPKAAGAKSGLLERLTDDWPDVRLIAAEALAGLGEIGRAVPVVAASVKSEDAYECLAALNTLDFLRGAGHVPLADVQTLAQGVVHKGAPITPFLEWIHSLTGTP